MLWPAMKAARRVSTGQCTSQGQKVRRCWTLLVCAPVAFRLDNLMRLPTPPTGFTLSSDWNFKLFEDKMYFMWDALVKCKIFDKSVIIKDREESS